MTGLEVMGVLSLALLILLIWLDFSLR